MENNNRDKAHNASPENDWQNTGENNTRNTDDQRLYATERDKEEDDDNDEDEDEDETGDWGHVDPAESNSPFPDPNAPSAPGSAV